MCEDIPTLKEQARKIADSELISVIAKRVEFGNIILRIQDKKIINIRIEQSFR